MATLDEMRAAGFPTPDTAEDCERAMGGALTFAMQLLDQVFNSPAYDEGVDGMLMERDEELPTLPKGFQLVLICKPIYPALNGEMPNAGMILSEEMDPERIELLLESVLAQVRANAGKHHPPGAA